MGKLLQGEELKQRADELGVSMTKLYSSMGTINEPELQRRVLEAEAAEREISSTKREKWMWRLTVLSTLAGILSALAAWVAITSA